jgi:endogenous inhibitor of DNA gyrase (YacG/DUF329 family)
MATPPPAADFVAACPSCKKPVADDSPAIPFCSPRCKLLDLGNWLTGRYVVSSPLSPDELVDLDNEGGRNKSELS